MYDKYLKELDEVGAVKISNFFNSSMCSNFLSKHINIFNEKLSLNIPGNENSGNNLRVGNKFYGKKDECWEVYKANLDIENVLDFKNELNVLGLGEFWSSQIVMRKKFKENVLPCHVDNFYDPKIKYFQCGIYLTDSTLEDGIFIIEKTHNIPTKEYLIDDTGMKRKYISANKGDLIIHNSYTWHGSNNNVKQEGRVTLYIKFIKHEP